MTQVSRYYFVSYFFFSS